MVNSITIRSSEALALDARKKISILLDFLSDVELFQQVSFVVKGINTYSFEYQYLY